MKKFNSLVFLFILVICTIPARINGQISKCYNNYDKALAFYNSGMSDSALATLKPCLENKELLGKVPKETRTQIYRLAALSSIMTGDGVRAEEYIKEMIINQPDYKANPNKDDLMEFKQILDKIEIKPSFMIGVMAGTNYSFVNLQKQYFNYTMTYERPSFETILGFNFELFAEKTMTKNISLEAVAGFLRNHFIYNNTGFDSTKKEAVFNQYDQEVNWLEISLSPKYNFYIGQFRPYIKAGISGRFLLNQAEKSDEFGKYWFTNSSTSGTILTTFNSDFNYLGILLGGGTCYNLKKLSLRFDIRYIHYFNDSSVTSNFENGSLFSDVHASEPFHYTDEINIINLRSLQICAGVIYTLKYKVF